MTEAATTRSRGRQEWRRYVAFSFATSDLLIELDRDLVICFVSGAVVDLVGVPVGALRDKALLQFVGDADRAMLGDAIGALAPGQRMAQRTIAFTAGRSQVLLTGFRLPDDEGRVYLAGSRLLVPVRARTDPERDPDTGLWKGDDFTEMVEHQIQLLHAAGQDAALSLFQVSELDDLRSRLGDPATRELLRELASLLRVHSVGGDSAARFAEDKYGIVHAPGSVVSALTHKITDLIRKTDPTGSSGVENRTLSLTDVLLDNKQAAEAVKYVVNRFVDEDLQSLDLGTLEEGLDRQMAETVERISSLKRTVAENAISLVFQPIVDLTGRAIHHYEALSRFTGGNSPFETIAFAEQVGIVQDFDLAVAVKTRDFVRENLSEFPDLRIAVNLSPRSLESDGFVDALRDLMREDPGLRSRILFELTESYKVRNIERLAAITQSLRHDGHLACLDDFGAGGASFDYLQAIHVDFVKLDGMYVRQMMDNHRDSCILVAMADLCRTLKSATIAEFVENEGQAQRLQALGVGFGQGWLFGRPEPRPVAETRERLPQAVSVSVSPVRARAKRRVGEDTVWA